MGHYSSDEMDSDGWELLRDDGLFDGITKDFVSKEIVLNDKLLLDVNYFVNPSVHPLDSHLVEESEEKEATDLISSTLKIGGDDEILKSDEDIKEIDQCPVVDISIVKEIKEIMDTEVVETLQFVDMKVESLVFDEIFDRKDQFLGSAEFVGAGKHDGGDLNSLIKEEKDGGFMIWRWRVHGIGALCSFGIAAATICIIIFGRQRQKQYRYLQKRQKIGFDAYADDSRITQAVRHASRLNQVISAGRGVSSTGAQISFGGYYSGM